MSAPNDVVVAMMAQAFRDGVPHNKAIGMRIVDVEYGAGVAILELPYDPKLAGDPESEIMHGGAITTLMDACCGAAVFMKLVSPTPIATLDLRIDYLKPATPGKTVYARAECYKATRNVAFVRATAYHVADDVIAAGMGTFMISTPGKPVVGSP